MLKLSYVAAVGYGSCHHTLESVESQHGVGQVADKDLPCLTNKQRLFASLTSTDASRSLALKYACEVRDAPFTLMILSKVPSGVIK